MGRLCFSRGQNSLEVLVLTVALLFFVAVIGGTSFIMFTDSVSSNMISDSLRNLQSGVGQVYALGPHNALIVSVSLPNTVRSSFVGGLSGSEFGFDVDGSLGSQRFFAYTDVNVTGQLPSAGGNYRVKIESVGSRVFVSVVQ